MTRDHRFGNRKPKWLSASESKDYLDLYRDVLVVAIRDMKRTHIYSNLTYAALGEKTRKWFYDTKSNHPFSFLNCCRALGYSPKTILRELAPYRKPIIPKQSLSTTKKKEIQKKILARLFRHGSLTITDLSRSRIPKRITGAEMWEIRAAAEGLVRSGHIKKEKCKINKQFFRYALSKKGKIHMEKICRASDI